MAFRYKVDHNTVTTSVYDIKQREIVNWCLENIGDPLITWRCYSMKWHFRFKKDYLLFLLRWA
jgi:hypothetical protein